MEVLLTLPSIIHDIEFTKGLIRYKYIFNRIK